MDYKKIQDFVRAIAKSGATEVHIETDELKITVKTPQKGKVAQTETTYIQQIPLATQVTAVPQMQMAPQMQTMQPVTTTTPVVEAEKKEEDISSKYITIKAPMVGTFYRKPSPDKPVYVSIGDNIETGKTICIIEAMKLFNEIEAEVSGKVVKILVDDATPIEFDQPLFLVDPA